MSEEGKDEILDQIKIPEDTGETVARVEVDTNLLEEINLFEERREVRRIRRELPSPDQVTLLGERDERFEQVFVDSRVLQEMTDYLMSDLTQELGGGLVGHYREDPRTNERFTLISALVTDPHGKGTEGAYQFTPDSWARLNRIVDLRENDESIVGWVHAHPHDYPPVPSGADSFIMKHFFNLPEQSTLILGRGGSYDRKYALWRWQNNQGEFQNGIGVVGGDSEAIRENFKYFERGEVAEAKKLPEVKETWFRRSLKGIFSFLGIRLGKKTEAKLEEVLTITPDDWVDDVAELVTIIKEEEKIQERLGEVSDSLKSGKQVEEVIRITEEDLPPEKEPEIRITEEDLR